MFDIDGTNEIKDVKHYLKQDCKDDLNYMQILQMII